MNYPHTTVILAMSADGKISDTARSAPDFTSNIDRAHLERQVARADAILFGAETLRAHGSAMSISNPDLLAQRQEQGKPKQPIQIACTRSGNIPLEIRFFQQNVPRWLLTTEQGAQQWQNKDRCYFEEVIYCSKEEINWPTVFQKLANQGIERLAVLGGGELVAALFAEQLLDELWLTICPILLGGRNAPTPIEGIGFDSKNAQKLKILSVETIEKEVFLHYEVLRESQS